MKDPFCKLFNFKIFKPSMRNILGAGAIFAFASFADGGSHLRADTLLLKDGTVRRNVIVIVLGGQAAVVSKNGRTSFVKLKKIRRISHKNVSWKRRVKNKTVIVKVVDREAMEKQVTRMLAEKLRAEEKRRRSQDTRLASMWRSAVFPGWGQLHDGHTALGYSLMGVTGLALVGYASTVARYNSAQSDYQDVTLPFVYFQSGQGLIANYFHFQDRRQAITTASRNANIVAGAVIIYWTTISILSFTGVFLDARKPSFGHVEPEPPRFALDWHHARESIHGGRDRRLRFVFRGRF